MYNQPCEMTIQTTPPLRAFEAVVEMDVEPVGSSVRKLQRFKRRKLTSNQLRSSSAIDHESGIESAARIELQHSKDVREETTLFSMTALEFWAAKKAHFPSLYHVFLGSRSARPASARPIVPLAMSTQALNNLLVLKDGQFYVT